MIVLNHFMKLYSLDYNFRLVDNDNDPDFEIHLTCGGQKVLQTPVVNERIKYLVIVDSNHIGDIGFSTLLHEMLHGIAHKIRDERRRASGFPYHTNIREGEYDYDGEYNIMGDGGFFLDIDHHLILCSDVDAPNEVGEIGYNFFPTFNRTIYSSGVYNFEDVEGISQIVYCLMTQKCIPSVIQFENFIKKQGIEKIAQELVGILHEDLIDRTQKSILPNIEKYFDMIEHIMKEEKVKNWNAGDKRRKEFLEASKKYVSSSIRLYSELLLLYIREKGLGTANKIIESLKDYGISMEALKEYRKLKYYHLKLI